MLKAQVDADFYAVLKLFKTAAADVGAPWLVVGATARILLLERVYGLPIGRATQDVDFAVLVDDWEHFRALCDRLQRDSLVDGGERLAKRIRTRAGKMFDLLPYGGVEEKGKQVFWPPDRDFLMTVRGFAGAGRTAITVCINGDLDVPVVSPAGLCALKLFAWEERGAQEAGRDAGDLAYLFHHIESLLPASLLHEAHPDRVTAADYDLQLAAMAVLGEQVSALLDTVEHVFLVGFVDKEVGAGTDGRLARDLHKHLPTANPERVVAMLSALFRGLGTKSA